MIPPLQPDSQGLVYNSRIFVRYHDIKGQGKEPQLAYRNHTLRMLEPSTGLIALIQRLAFRVLVHLGFYKTDQATIDTLMEKSLVHLRGLFPCSHPTVEAGETLTLLRVENEVLRSELATQAEKFRTAKLGGEYAELCDRLITVQSSFEMYRLEVSKQIETLQAENTQLRRQAQFPSFSPS